MLGLVRSLGQCKVRVSVKVGISDRFGLGLTLPKIPTVILYHNPSN